MLDVTPDKLRLERDSAVKFRDLHTEASKDLIASYVGSDFQSGFTSDIESHENHGFEHCVHAVPALVYHQPKVVAKSRRPKVHRELVKGLEHVMNRWVHDIDFAAKMDEPAHVVQFHPHAPVLITLEPVPGYEDWAQPWLRPALHPISPDRFFMDPQAYRISACRYMGHDSVRDWQDLYDEMETDPITGKRRPVYNREVLNLITPDANLEEPDDERRAGLEASNRVPRKQVRFFEVWVPERGMIYTMACDAQGDAAGYLRPPRMFFGPPWGPYTVFSLYFVPDSIFGLAPLVVTRGLVDELNAHIDQVRRQADEARQITFVNASNTLLVAAVKDSPNGDIVGIPGFDPTMIAEVNIAGPSAESLEYIQVLRDRLDRKSGIPDFERGNVTGDATARENSLAAAASDFRRRFMQIRFHRGVRQVLESAAWYMCESRNVGFAVPVPQERPTPKQLAMASGAQLGPAAGGQAQPAGPPPISYEGIYQSQESEDAWFIGGHHPGEDFNFFDLEITFEVNSMELRPQGIMQAELKQFFDWILALAPQILAAPYVNWPEVITAYADSLNIPDARRYINWTLVEQMLGGAVPMAGNDQPETIPGVEGAPMPKPDDLTAGSGVKAPPEGGKNPIGIVQPPRAPGGARAPAMAGAA